MDDYFGNTDSQLLWIVFLKWVCDLSQFLRPGMVPARQVWDEMEGRKQAGKQAWFLCCDPVFKDHCKCVIKTYYTKSIHWFSASLSSSCGTIQQCPRYLLLLDNEQ